MTLTARILSLAAFLSLFFILSTSVAALDTRDLSARRARHIAHARSPAPSPPPLKRRGSGKCRARPTSIPQPSPTSTQAPSSSAPPPAESSPSSAPKPASSSNPPSPPPSPKPSNPNKGNGGSGKVGLAWYQGDSDVIYNVLNGQVHSYYTWSTSRVPKADQAGLEFLPQLWGRGDVDQFKKVALGLNAEYYLGFNECNEVGQSNMQPSEAIKLWKDAMTPLKKAGKKTVCPAMSSRPNGLDWVKTFLRDGGEDCDCDVIALHWYDNSPEKLIAYVNLWHNTFPNKPLWITEFAFQNFNGPEQPSLDQIQGFMRNATAWLDSQPFVGRYMPFGFGNPLPGGVNPDNALLGGDGKPTTLGKIVLHSS